MLLSWPQHALDATHLAFYWNFQRALGVFTLLTISRAFRQFLFALFWDMPARSWRCSLGFSWTFFCLIFLWRIKLQHALDATLLASSWDIPHSWWYVLGSGSDTLLMLCAEPSLGTVRDALDATVHHNCDITLLTFSWNFQRALVGATLRLLMLRYGESHALGAALLALFWNTQGALVATLFCSYSSFPACSGCHALTPNTLWMLDS